MFRLRFTQLMIFILSILSLPVTIHAQDSEIDQLSPQELSARADAEKFITNQVPGCSVTDWVEYGVLRYETYNEIRISIPGYTADYYITTEDGEVLDTGVKFPGQATVAVPPGVYLDVTLKDDCGTYRSVAIVDPSPRPTASSLKVDPTVYSVITAWQRTAQPLADYLRGTDALDLFTKKWLLQELLFEQIPYRDGVARTKSLPGKEDLTAGKTVVTECFCNLVELAMGYSLSPYERIVDRGNIYGDYGSNTDQRFRQQRDLRADQYWAYEGPSRYQEMFVRTLNCVNAPYEFYWTRDAVAQEGDREGDDELPLDFRASIEFNWVCVDEDGATKDCECERNMIFSWDYESIVKANAEIITGGWCGSNRFARAHAVDAVGVSIAEIYEPSTFELLAFQLNGQESNCEQTYQGPTPAEFLDFAFSIYQISQGPPDGSDQEEITEWEEGIFNDVRQQIDEAFDEPWLDRTPCDVDLSGSRRSLGENNQRTDHRSTLHANRPVRVTLGASGSMEAAGLRRWKTNTSIYSSFRLAGMLQGGGNSEDHCCSPDIGSWLLSNLAARSPNGSGAAQENSYMNRTETMFALNGFSLPVSRHTGHGFDYNGFTCPTRVVITIVAPRVGGDEDDYRFSASGGVITISPREPTTIPDGATYELITASGQILQTVDGQTGNPITFNTSSLPAGVYFIRITAPGQQPVTRKIILS